MKKYLIASLSIAMMFMIVCMIGYGVPIYKIIVMGIDVLLIYIANWFMKDNDE